MNISQPVQHIALVASIRMFRICQPIDAILPKAFAQGLLNSTLEIEPDTQSIEEKRKEVDMYHYHIEDYDTPGLLSEHHINFSICCDNFLKVMYKYPVELEDIFAPLNDSLMWNSWFWGLVEEGNEEAFFNSKIWAHELYLRSGIQNSFIPNTPIKDYGIWDSNWPNLF